jgi:hypothetical protein
MAEKNVTVQFLYLVLYFCIHIAVYPCPPTGSNTSVVAITYSILNTAALEQQSHKKAQCWFYLSVATSVSLAL